MKKIQSYKILLLRVKLTSNTLLHDRDILIWECHMSLSCKMSLSTFQF